MERTCSVTKQLNYKHIRKSVIFNKTHLTIILESKNVETLQQNKKKNPRPKQTSRELRTSADSAARRSYKTRKKTAENPTSDQHGPKTQENRPEKRGKW